MAKPNYSFEKRQRDLAKKAKQEEKRLNKLANKASQNSANEPDIESGETPAAPDIPASNPQA